MKKVIVTVLCSAFCVATLFAQQPAVKWTASMEPMKRFIENRSQFDQKNELAGGPVLFAVDHGSTRIFFIKNGLTFHLEKKKNEKPEHERMKEEKWKQAGYEAKEEKEDEQDKSHVVHLEWLGANPAATVIGLDIASDYFSYPVGEGAGMKSINYIKGYQKLLYKNLYPNIDVEYTFHPAGGIKYQIILHPGADAAQVKMRYSGAESVALDAIGNIRLRTVFGDIVDNAPVTFYEGKESDVIGSRYKITGNIISFEVDKHSIRKTVIIDPWTITPAMPFVNKVYNIKADKDGNVYVYGGDTPYRLQKYNAAGTLLWTYNTPWSAANNWFGGMTVEPNGNAYITTGTGSTISKIDSSGILVWSNAFGGGLSTAEYWIPVFNCDYTQLLVGGTNFLNGYVFNIDLSSGAVSSTTRVAATTSSVGIPIFNPNEVRSMCYSPNGNYYFLTIDTIGSLSSALTMNYRDTSFYNFAYYLPYGQGGGQGFNGIAATENLLYTSDGRMLHKRDIHTGRILSSVTIPNGSTDLTSGVAVDSCGNVYVGSITKLHKYDMNLNLLATVSTPAAVYDVAVSASGDVLACGHGFALSVDMNSCNPPRPVCTVPLTATMSHTNAACYGECNGTATATPTNGNAPYSYLWSNGQSTETSTNLCAGTYSVTVKDASNRTFVGSVAVEHPALITLNINSVGSGCLTSAVVTPTGGTPPFSYLWSNGDTLGGISNIPTGTYSVLVTDANNCSAAGSVNITQTTSFTLTDSIVSPACGACDGSATIIPTGGNPPFTYLWSNGETTQTVTNLCAGTYTVTVTESIDTNGVVFWSENFTSGGTGWTLNINGPGPNDNDANFWIINSNRNSCAQCPASGSGGNYLHVSCSAALCGFTPNTCAYNPGAPFNISNASTDKYVSSPNISTLNRSNITLTFSYISEGEATDYGLVRLSDDGGLSWTDLPATYFGVFTCTQAVIPIPPQYENIPNFRIGFRWINDNNTEGSDPPFMIDDIELRSVATTACNEIALVNVASDGGPAISASSISVSCNSLTDGAIDITTSGGVPPYSYAWSNGDSIEDLSGLEGGVYLVSVTDINGCLGLQSVTIEEPAVIFATASVTNAGCSPTGRIDLSVNGGTTPYTYLWSNNLQTQDLNNVAAGAYTVTVTDSKNCEKTASFTVNASGSIGLALIVNDVSCYGAADGSVTANVTGGNPPIQFNWNSRPAGAALTNISGGTYSVTVSDGNNCTATQTVILAEPNPFTVSASITRVLCEGGNEGGIKLNPLGGVLPYAVAWAHGDSSFSLTDLAPGVYTATITDANGCSLDTAIDLSATSIYQVEAGATSSSCGGGADGSIFASITSGTTPPYTYLWNTGETDSVVANVAPGTYSVTVTDGLSCVRADTVLLSEGGLVIEDSVIHASCPRSADGAVFITVLGGTPPYSYAWSNGSTAPNLQNVQANIYSVTVTDPNNCTGSDTAVVTVDTTGATDCDKLEIYDVFSPNGDGVNDVWIIDGIENYAGNELQIFNRWGNAVFEANPYVNDWKGISDKGEALPSAVYYYILKLNDGNKTVYSGSLTLIR